MISKEAAILISNYEDILVSKNSPIPTLQIIRFMLKGMDLIREHCPPAAIKALTAAEKFCRGKATAKDLEDARTECWSYLDDKKASLSPKKKEYCATRAAICTLYSEIKDDDVYTSLEFFIEMVCRCGNYDGEIKELIKTYLLDC